MSTHTLTPEVRAVLEGSVFTANSLQLPSGRLERKLYAAVNKVIEFAGGKWNKKQQAHVFAGDPKEKLGLAIQTGKIVNEKKLLQAFYTPAGLAAKMATIASVQGHVVLEPSAGGGALVKACIASGATGVDCIELDPTAASKLEDFMLRSPTLVRVFQGDFLKTFLSGDNLGFSRIVMNPPFTNNQDIKHVAHAANNWLAPGGRLVALMFPNRDRKLLAELLERFPDHELEDIPAGTFAESGTDIATLLLTLNK